MKVYELKNYLHLNGWDLKKDEYKKNLHFFNKNKRKFCIRFSKNEKRVTFYIWKRSKDFPERNFKVVFGGGYVNRLTIDKNTGILRGIGLRSLIIRQIFYTARIHNYIVGVPGCVDIGQ